jgi:hypothetical protein
MAPLMDSQGIRDIRVKPRHLRLLFYPKSGMSHAVAAAYRRFLCVCPFCRPSVYEESSTILGLLVSVSLHAIIL